MSKFKVGDKIRSTASKRYSSADKIKKNKNYYVKGIVGKTHICINNDAPNLCWPSSLFRKVPSNGGNS